MKKIMCLLGLVVGLYYGIVQVRLESPLFQKQIDGFMEEMSKLGGFTIADSVDQPYNYVASHASGVADNVKQNFMSYFTGILFLTTVAILRLRGKTTKEAFRTAAFPTTIEEPPAIRRARAKTLRTQLIADQIGMEGQLRKLPEQIAHAEKGASFTRKHLIEMQSVCKKAQSESDEAESHLANLRGVKASLEHDLAQTQTEIENVTKGI